MKEIQLNLIIPQEYAGQRYDQALAALLPEYSRSLLQKWIKEHYILQNGQVFDASDRVLGGEEIKINAYIEDQNLAWQAQDIDLDIVYEDGEIIVINKPIHLVVHPAVGHYENTLVNALLHHYPQLQMMPRAGIIHRLDKDTSGLLVVAKTLSAQFHLIKQLQDRTVKRQYDAIVWGNIQYPGSVNLPIGRNPQNRKKMAVTHNGKDAITHYKVQQSFLDFTHLKINLETGRTHQIRVHMAYMKHPIVGDQTYGKSKIHYKHFCEKLSQFLIDFKRQALHASSLGLRHPKTNDYQEYKIPLPTDMLKLLQILSKYNSSKEQLG